MIHFSVILLSFLLLPIFSASSLLPTFYELLEVTDIFEVLPDDVFQLIFWEVLDSNDLNKVGNPLLSAILVSKFWSSAITSEYFLSLPLIHPKVAYMKIMSAPKKSLLNCPAIFLKAKSVITFNDCIKLLMSSRDIPSMNLIRSSECVRNGLFRRALKKNYTYAYKNNLVDPKYAYEHLDSFRDGLKNLMPAFNLVINRTSL